MATGAKYTLVNDSFPKYQKQWLAIHGYRDRTAGVEMIKLVLGIGNHFS